MKRKIKFYQTQFAPFTISNLIPKFDFSRNVQGWFFIRKWTFTLFRYAVTISFVVITDLNTEREQAHERNIAKYMAQ